MINVAKFSSKFASKLKENYIKIYKMLKSVCNSTPIPADMNASPKKRPLRPAGLCKRAHSASPVTQRTRSPTHLKTTAKDRRSQSLSPSSQTLKKLFGHLDYAQQNSPSSNTVNNKSYPCYDYQEPERLVRESLKEVVSEVESMLRIARARFATLERQLKETRDELETTKRKHRDLEQYYLMYYKAALREKDVVIPHCIMTKTMRAIATKKREFLKLQKNLLAQQNSLLEHYASLKELENRAGITDSALGEVRILSVKSWPAHDLLLLVRDDLEMPMNSEISGIFGPQVLQQLQAQLNPIPEEVLGVGAELMARRIELLNLLRCKHRSDRAAYITNLEWKAKNLEFDNETEKLHRMVAGTAENLKAKITYSLDLAKVPWMDRETMVKKIERLQKEIIILQHKIEEATKKDSEDNTKDPTRLAELTPSYQVMSDELAKERAARESLKEVVSAAESMLRVARARIATLERQLKETRNELETAKRKHRDLEQLYRHRETSYDARSRKLIEVSKTGEITIDTLSRQRDALEIRVKELREQAEAAERVAEARSAEERARAEMLQAKVAEQEKNRQEAELRAAEMEKRVRELEEQLNSLRERSVRLVDFERRRCLEYVPSKENEPSDREVDIWKELQITKVALGRAEEELRQSRADKESFLESLSKIAQEEGNDKQDKLAAELLNRERKIMKLQQVIEEQRENEKIMEQSMTEYENQMASLRLEIKRLRNYDCYSKEVSFQDLQTELLELNMQVETLCRERSALVTAAASRALMLERHERAADLFARMVRARRELAASLESRSEPHPIDDSAYKELSRSLTSVCAGAADTWTALRAERARVLRLESAVLAQSLHLEREGRVRTQLERRRAMLEREILRSRHSPTSQSSIQHPSLVFD